MGGVLDYSTTANSNTTVGGVSIAEGMASGSVNNAIRAEMADTRKWQLDWSGITTAGTGNAYTITSNQGIAAYADGMRFSFRADRANTGAATLNVDGRGAKALRKVSNAALAALVADDIVVGAVYDVVYLSGDDVFAIVGFAGLQASAFAQTLLDDATAADARTTLGVVIGTDVQAQGATLSSLEGLTLAAGDLLYATGADTLVNLAKGTAGQVLQMNTGATAPEWATPTPVLLGTLTTGGATIELPDLSGWDDVEVVGHLSSTVDLEVQFGIAGPTWRATTYVSDVHDGVSTSGSTTGVRLTRAISGVVTLRCYIQGLSSGYSAAHGQSSTNSRVHNGSGRYGSTEVHTLARLTGSGGAATFSDVNLRVYGVHRA